MRAAGVGALAGVPVADCGGRVRPLEEDNEILRRASVSFAAELDIVRTSMGIPEAELLRETVRAFGGTRAGPSTEPRLRAALALAERRGRVRHRNGTYLPA